MLHVHDAKVSPQQKKVRKDADCLTGQAGVRNDDGMSGTHKPRAMCLKDTDRYKNLT